MTSIKLIFAIISFFEVFRTVIRLKRETIGVRSAIVWILMWAGIGFFCFFPHLLDSAMRLAQMQSRMFFVLIISVFILFAVVFNLSSRMEKMQRDMSKIIQEIAMINYKNEDNRQSIEEKEE